MISDNYGFFILRKDKLKGGEKPSRKGEKNGKT